MSKNIITQATTSVLPSTFGFGSLPIGRTWGAKLLWAANHAGIRWVVVRTWAVDSQDLERKLKNLKNSPRLCPICSPDLEGQVQNEYARMKWELDHSAYNPDHPLPW